MSKPTWKTVLEIAKLRRTYYSIKPSSTLSDADLTTILKEAVNHSPTAYNNQSTRAILVLGQKNTELWKALWEAYKETFTSPEHEANARAKFETAYLSSYGTYVFFDDQDVVKRVLDSKPGMEKAFTAWIGNAAGMLQYIVWTALEAAGMGANLQHPPQVAPATFPIIREHLQTPESWTVSAVIPFGEKAADAKPRTYEDIDTKVRVVQ